MVGDGVLRLVNLQVLGAKEALGKEGLAVFSGAASRTPAPGSHQVVCSRGSPRAGVNLHWVCAWNVSVLSCQSVLGEQVWHAFVTM